MPTYIAFGDWTDQGARAIRESPQRLDAAKRQLEEMGGRFVAFWMTMGQHDMVLVYETPDDAVAARFTLVLNGLGSVRTRRIESERFASERAAVLSPSVPSRRSSVGLEIRAPSCGARADSTARGSRALASVTPPRKER